MEDILWNLFKNTGDIKYFVMLKKLREENNKDLETE